MIDLLIFCVKIILGQLITPSLTHQIQGDPSGKKQMFEKYYWKEYAYEQNFKNNCKVFPRCYIIINNYN